MAQQDYFSKIGGQYGQLAGSILSDKRRRKKKDAFTAKLIADQVKPGKKYFYSLLMQNYKGKL